MNDKETINTQNIIENLFSNTVIIKPAPNSGRFFKTDDKMTAAIQETKGKNALGEEVVVASSPYSAQRFEGTRQRKGARFNYSKRKFGIIDPEDATKTQELTRNSEVLNALVKACRLTVDIEDHPDFGKPITKADIFDRKDPFFIHRKFNLTLEAGEAIVPTSHRDPLNVLAILVLMTHKEFSVGTGNKRSPRKTGVRYIIVDKNLQKAEKKKTRSKDKKANELYHKLNDEHKSKLAVALGLLNTNKLDSDIIDDLIYDYATDNITFLPKTNGKTKQDIFIETLSKGRGYLNASYMFHIAKSKGIISYTNKVFNAYGHELGLTSSEAINYLTLESSNAIYERIAEAVKMLD
jgi:hypothetical protein